MSKFKVGDTVHIPMVYKVDKEEDDFCKYAITCAKIDRFEPYFEDTWVYLTDVESVISNCDEVETGAFQDELYCSLDKAKEALILELEGMKYKIEKAIDDIGKEKK